MKRRTFLKGFVALSISVPVVQAQNCIPSPSLPEPDPEPDLDPLQSLVFDDTGHWCYGTSTQGPRAMFYCTIPYDMTTTLPANSMENMTWVL